MCRDYITEKFYSRLGDFLPIVLKRSIYKGLFPDDGFIAVDDFQSPKELANYLKYLQANRTAYMELVFKIPLPKLKVAKRDG